MLECRQVTAVLPVSCRCQIKFPEHMAVQFLTWMVLLTTNTELCQLPYARNLSQQPYMQALFKVCYGLQCHSTSTLGCMNISMGRRLQNSGIRLVQCYSHARYRGTTCLIGMHVSPLSFA